MKRKTKLYLGYSEWPATDKAVWESAFEPGTDLFDDGGPGAHLAERTLSQLKYTYGKYLYFLSVEHADLLKRAPAERVNASTIKEFAKWQPASCGGVTLSIYLYHLWLALRYLYPKKDWSWLLSIANRIKAGAKPKPEQHHLVTSDTLYKLGLKLMDNALASGKPPTSWRVHAAYRDGLAIALLALIAPRRRTLAALRIGKHLKKSEGQWFLDIPAEDVKTKRPLEYPLSPELSEHKPHPITSQRCKNTRLPLGIQPRPLNAGPSHLQRGAKAHPQGAGVSNQSASLSPRRSNVLVSARPGERARLERPARPCVICDDREILHHGPVAPCRACSGSGHRQRGRKAAG
jgi:hypothetical protein